MRHIIPELELEQIKNLDEITLSEPSDSIMDEKITYRRKRVNQLRLAGYTNQQIAQKIGCNLSTVEKDLHEIRENARHWFNNESINEYCQSVNDGIILCDVVIEELWLLYREETNSEIKTRILSLISTNEDKKLQLYKETNIVKRFLGENHDE